MAAPAQRRAIDGDRQYFTFRQTRRSVPMAFSMIFVQASDRAQFGRQAKPRDSEHLVEPF